MRKLDKTKILAKEYFEWQQSPESKEQEYRSSGKYYKDIVANLLWIQGGVCAYTEEFLCKKDDFAPEYWKNGRFTNKNNCIYGELEHFDSDKKKKEPWDWDNFFFVSSDINRRKSTKKVSLILKPDSEDYDPFNLLEYDCNEHIFIANTDLDAKKQQEINQMIEVLGINYAKDKRAKYIKGIKFLSKLGEETNPYQFFTAIEFCKKD